MDVLRMVDAFCASCDDVRPHAVLSDDPSSCFCNSCGTCQTLVVPLAESKPGDTMQRLVSRDRHSRPARGEIWFSDSRVRPRHRADSRPLDDGIGRSDMWRADNALAGAALLADAMQYQDDLETLRLCARTMHATLEAVQRRGPRAVPSMPASNKIHQA